MFKSLNRVFTRILLLAALAFAGLGAFGWLAIEQSRTNLYDQKKADIRHVVEVTKSMVAALEKRAASGEITRDQAQAEAKKLIAALRYQGNEYVFVLGNDHTMVVHPTKPDRVGKNLANERDPSGRFYIREFVSVANAGGGHVAYGFQPPKSTEYKDKISYVTAFKPWGWVIASGVLIDDVEAMHARMTHSVLLGLGVIALVMLIGAFLVTRSIVRPLGRLGGSLQRLASGDIDAEVAGADRSDEFGTIARAALGVRETVRARMQEQMKHEEAGKAEADAERRKFLTELAASLDAQVKALVDSVGEAAGDLVETARSMQSISDSARAEALEASRVSRVAADHIGAVGSAAGQLDTAIDEIGSRVTESSKIAQDAVTQTREAHGIVRTLSDATAEIGKVVSLIQEVAEQTNLLALNATIEAARAGEAGKGFAVVAAEVKSLANQTAKATEEISARINAVVEATGKAVSAIDNVDKTITRINEIASTIAAAVEEQGAATAEIARVVGETSRETESLSQSLDRLQDAASNTNMSSDSVVTAATGLADQSAALKTQIAVFVSRLAAA